MFMISTSFVPDFLIQQIEKKYPVFELSQLHKPYDTVHILVLGSGHVNDDRLEPYDQLTATSLKRILEGIRINRMLPNSKIITSGFEGKETLSNAEVTARTAISFGVNPSGIIRQENPENTNEEAIEYQKRFGTTPTLILVTSAAHMHRSVMLFEKQGLHPIPAPTDHLYKRSQKARLFSWIPYAYNIRTMESAMHEYIGLLYAKLTG